MSNLVRVHIPYQVTNYNNLNWIDKVYQNICMGQNVSDKDEDKLKLPDYIYDLNLTSLLWLFLLLLH